MEIVHENLFVDFRIPLVIDIKLIRSWLARSHVHRWWRDDGTDEFFKMLELGIGLPEYIDMFIVDMNRCPIGYIEVRQPSRDIFGIWKNVAGLEDDMVAIKFLIGDKSLTNRRIGRLIIRTFIVKIFNDHNISRVIAAPHPDNWAGIIMLKRLGFRDRGRINGTGINAVLLTLSRSVFSC